MKIVEMLEFALKSNDLIGKSLPALKLMTDAFPFPNLHRRIRHPQIIKYLLQLYPFISETIDMILNELLALFQDDKDWINGCFKSLEELATLSSKNRPYVVDAKFYALDFMENALNAAVNLNIEIDDKCYVFVIFLKHADSEQMVLKIMNKIEDVKQSFSHKIKQLNHFDELVEQTVLSLYQEELQRNSEEQHFKNVAIEVKEQQMKRQPLKTPSLYPIQDFDSLSESQVDIQQDGINIEEILSKERPRLEFDQCENFRSVDQIQNLLLFITDPVAQQPSLIFETDPLSDLEYQLDPLHFKKFRHSIKLDKLYTLRSYKTMLFLTDLHNHQLILEVNQHFMQIVFRSLSGFFQNPLSYGNINHMVCLIQFYLKQEVKETIYYIFYFNVMHYFLDYLYNSYVQDLLLRILDPTNKDIPLQLHNLVWSFLSSQNYIQYLIHRITNKDFLGNPRKDFSITKEGYNVLKLIFDSKITIQEDFQQGQSNQLDHILGPLMAGKTISDNLQFLKRSILKKKPSQVLSNRRMTDVQGGSMKQIKYLQIAEYVNPLELSDEGQDLDRLKLDVIESTIDQADAICMQNLKMRTHERYMTAVEGMAQLQSASSQRSSPEINKLANSRTQEIQLPPLTNRGLKGLNQTPSFRRVQRQNTKESSTHKKKQLVIEEIDDYCSTFRSLNPLISPNSAGKLFVYYPNSENNVIDTIMREEIEQYQQENNEGTAYLSAFLLKHICFMFNKYNDPVFEMLLDDKLINLDKLLNHFTLRIIDLSQKTIVYNSAYESSLIIIKILQFMKPNTINDQLRIYKTYIPKLCRNIAQLHNHQQFQKVKIQLFEIINPLSSIKYNLFKCLQLMITNIRQKNNRILLKLNDTALHILNLELFSHITNHFYQKVFYNIVNHILIYGSDKQILALLFKVNLIEGISNGYQNAVINGVVVSDWNVDDFLLTLASLSQIILNAIDLRDDLQTLKQTVIRLQAYSKLKELLQLYLKKKTNILPKLEQQFFEQLKQSEQKLFRIKKHTLSNV